MTYPEEVAFQEGWLAAVIFIKECFRPGIDKKDEFIEQMMETYNAEMAHLQGG
jgi:hypothetical protein